jgi:hypothetical protein
MSSIEDIPSLSNLAFSPYISDTGELPLELQNQIGVYAIFDRQKVLQFVGYSRDIYLSLKQHLVRRPEACYWVKSTTIDRPNRTFLTEVQSAWIAENTTMPVGNDVDSSIWLDPIDTNSAMTAAESASLTDLDEVAKIKLFKQVARRVESKILAQLQERGVTTEIRFNPKLKEQGLLDLK